jgi:hypothetical protein
LTEFAKGGIITPGPDDSSDLVPALLSPGCELVILTDNGDPEDWACGFCDRGQCARCSDEDCTCCNGNPDA